MGTHRNPHQCQGRVMDSAPILDGKPTLPWLFMISTLVLTGSSEAALITRTLQIRSWRFEKINNLSNLALLAQKAEVGFQPRMSGANPHSFPPGPIGSQTQSPPPFPILVASGPCHLFIIIDKYLSRTTADIAMLLFPQQHAVRESWEYPVLERMML